MAERLDSSEQCPCGTGRTYANCCWDKPFDWVISDDGEISRRITIGDELREVLDDLDDKFMRIFGRSHLPADPIYLGKYMYSESDLERETIDLMRRAGTRPELIYTYKKTDGLLVTEENVDDLPTQDRLDWDKAIGEYFETDEYEPISYEDAAWLDMSEEITNLIIVFGYLLENGISENYVPNSEFSEIMAPEQYCLMCASRAFKTLRSISYLLDKEIGADALALTRNLYENYLHVVFVRSHPAKLADLVDAAVGLKSGTFEYAKSKKGHRDRRVVVEKETGRKFEGIISRHRMAASSPIPVDIEMLDSLYEFLSEFSHPGLPFNQMAVSDDVLSPITTELQHEATLYSSFFSVLLLDQLRSSTMLHKQMKQDLAIVVLRVREKILKLVEGFIDPDSENDVFNQLTSRLKIIDA